MKLFDWVSPLYDRLFPFSDPTRLLELLALEPHHRLLDVGGGTGQVTTWLCERVAHACIVDAAPGMLRQARERGLCTCRGVAERLPFPSRTFDRVLVVDAFHHFADWPRAAGELLRVLRPDGRVVIEESDIRHPVVKLVALGERLLLMGSRFYAPHDLAQMFHAAGGETHTVEQGNGTYWTIARPLGVRR